MWLFDCQRTKVNDVLNVNLVNDVLNVIKHEVSRDRVIQRFKNGLRFFQLWFKDELVATTWIVPGSIRYLDELALALPLDENELWVRDAFVSPKFRGKRVFAIFVQMIVDQNKDHIYISRVWSDVGWKNHASMQAHKAAGFTLFARVRGFECFGHFCVRGPRLSWHKDILEVKPDNHFIWLRGRKLMRHRQLIA